MKLGDVLDRLLKFFSELAKAKNITVIVLVLSFAMALTLRIVPARWGTYLTEFDPFYEYYIAKKICEKGVGWWFHWWFEPVHEKDKLFWYPYGRDLRASSPPGISIISAYTFKFLRWLGINTSLYVVHAYTPALWASLAVIGAFLLARRIGDEAIGGLAAFLLAISSAFISRTSLGGKHEAVAIPLMLFSFYLLLRSLDEGRFWLKASSGILGGLLLGFVAVSWGGYIYPWNLAALYVIVISILGWLKPSDAASYILYNFSAVALIAITPRYGPKIALFSAYAFIPLLASLDSLAVLVGALGKLRKLIFSRRFHIGLLISLIAICLALWKIGLLAGIAGRIAAVIVPSHRSPLIESVSEHRVPTWASFFSDYHILLPLSFLGLYRLSRIWNKNSVFIVIYYVTSLYAASSLARLTLLFSPAVAILSSYGLSTLFYVLMDIIKGEVRVPRRRRELASRLKESASLGILVLVLVTVVSVAYFNPVPYASTPSLLLTSTIGVTGEYYYQYNDWVSALEWMKVNLPKNAVVASWWDYGYWIAVNTNRSSICDNGTINGTQIAQVAKAFLSPEEEAIKIFKRLGVTHVVVFEPFQYLSTPYGIRVYFAEPHGLGDFGKSYWMARIAGLNASKYMTEITYTYGGYSYRIRVPANTTEAREATLYHLLYVRAGERTFYIFEPVLGTRLPGYPSNAPFYEMPSPKYFKLVYASQPNAWVLVFKVLYPKEGAKSS